MLGLALSLVVTFASADEHDVERQARAAIDRAAGFDHEWVPDGHPVADVKVNDDARVGRFVGALAGGLVGAAATMALLPLGDDATPFSAVHGFLSALAPLLTMTGAFVGYQIMGGDGAFAVTSAAMLPAGLALVLLLLTVPPELNSVRGLLPQVLTGLVLLAAGSALALDLRQRQLERLGSARQAGSASAGRVAAEAALGALAVSAAAALVGGVVALGGSAALGIGFGIVLGAGGLAGAAAASWGVHAALRGKGSYGAALGGLVVGAVGGALVAFVGALNSSSRGGVFGPASILATIAALEVPAITAMMFSALGLELSHTTAVGEESAASVTVGGAPMPGGAMLAAGVRF